MADNPLVDDRDVAFLLHDVHDAAGLTDLPAFAEHDRETFDLFVDSARRLAREHLWPAFRPMDEAPPTLEDGRITVHPAMQELWPRMVELGLLGATRPEAAGGLSLPLLVSTAADVYLMAANASAFGYVGLTRGAAHLVESFGDEALRERFMVPMMEGRWTGTMALTEPQAGSSLSDITTRARPTGDGHHLVQGAKIFISGGDHDLTDNVVHMTLARIEGAPAGTRGISLFAVPRRREQGGQLVDNDVSTAGAIHKIGWRGLPSLVLSYGERDDCHGWLVGEPHQGLSCMFQMMNEARIMVGLNGVATASVAYHESLAYARGRPQGRGATDRDPARPQVPIVQHADVRRMLLRQKAIVEGSLSLAMAAARYSDLAEHATDEAARRDAWTHLDLLTPIVKSFPAERGFEANALSVQIHGGYGYSSEYLPEAWLRDQKLNSIHEGTTQIQAIDLVGRKMLRDGGAGLSRLATTIGRDLAAAADVGLPDGWRRSMDEALATVVALMQALGPQAKDDPDRALSHATDVLDLMSTIAIGWQWIVMATAAKRRLDASPSEEDFVRAKLATADYFMATELPRVPMLARRVTDDASFFELDPSWL